MKSKTLISLAMAIFFSLFLIASAYPIDVRQNSYGSTPGPSYGDWSYLIQSSGYLGSFFTSFDPVPTGAFPFGPDDGISFGSLAAGSSSNTLDYTINVGVSTPSSFPILNFYMWGDWNNNGDWGDAGELFVDLDFTPPAGGGTLTNTLTFSIPSFVSGNTWFNAVVSYDNVSAAIPAGTGDFTFFTYGEQEAYQQPVSASGATPEPSSLLLLALGLVGIGIFPKRREKKEATTRN